MNNMARWILAIYLVFLMTGALTFVIHPFFPTQDGPEHLFYVETLKKLKNNDEFYSEHIFLDERIIPNSLFNDLTGAMTQILPPIQAQKILLSQ